MEIKQTAFDCVNCFYNSCPHKADPALIKAKCSSSPNPEVEVDITVSDHKQIDLLCKDCTEFVKYVE